MLYTILAGLLCLISGIIIGILIYSWINKSLDFSENFKDIASQIIKDEQADLRKQHQEALDMKLKPLSDELNRFMLQVNALDKEGKEKIAVLKDNIEKLAQNNKTISEEAKKLTEALTLNQNIKGGYGEDLLSSILENSDLSEHIHFETQTITSAPDKNGETRTIRPDFIIKLPDNKSLIIDSKLTLDSFIEYQDKKNKETKLAFKSELKKRLKDLSDKNYQKADGLIQPEFILCYIPLETAINLIYSDEDFADLVKEFYLKNIIIVGTSSVLTTINIVKGLWAEQNRSKNFQEIAEIGKSLYEAFAKHFQELEEIQCSFDKLSDKFRTTINRYKTKDAKEYSILRQVEKLEDLGITPTLKIPEAFNMQENDK